MHAGGTMCQVKYGLARAVHLVAAAEDVHLVDEEDDLLAPLPDVLQEANLAVCERPICST